MVSNSAPIGTETSSSVTPKLPNGSPMTVGVPSRWAESGSTGTDTEYNQVGERRKRDERHGKAARRPEGHVTPSVTEPRAMRRESL